MFSVNYETLPLKFTIATQLPNCFVYKQSRGRGGDHPDHGNLWSAYANIFRDILSNIFSNRHIDSPENKICWENWLILKKLLRKCYLIILESVLSFPVFNYIWASESIRSAHDLSLLCCLCSLPRIAKMVRKILVSFVHPWLLLKYNATDW